MKIRVGLLAALALLAPFTAQAQTAQETAERAAKAAAEAAEAAEAMAARAEERAAEDERIRQQLEEAQKQLEAAAQEVARLSAEMSGTAMERVVRYFEQTGRKAMLGITINDQPDKAGAAAPGVRVYGVSPGGPADEAGLRAGDIIVAMNDQPMEAGDDGPADRALLGFMKSVEPGDSVRVRYSRGGELAETTVVTKAFEPEAFRFSFEDEQRALFGLPGDGDIERFVFRMDDKGAMTGSGGHDHLHLVPMTAGLGAYFGTEEGLLVVKAGGDDNALQDGDVIVRIDGEPPTDVWTAMKHLRSGEDVSLEVVRQRETISVQLSGLVEGDDGHRVTRRIEKRRIDPDSGEVERRVEEDTD